MITSAAATFLAGSLFLASTTTVKSPIRDYRSYATAPSGYTAYCARDPDCDSRLHPRRSALLAPKSADNSAPRLPAFGRMLVKERWFGNRIVTASAAPIADPVKPAAARPVLLPMLLKEHWFRERIPAVAAVLPAVSPAFASMALKERWLGNRIATASAAPVGDAVKPAIGYTHHLTSGANTASVIPAQAGIQRAAVQPRKGFKRDSGFRQNDDIGWSGRMTDLAPRHASIVQKAVASRRVLLPMHLKEHWFRERTLTPAVVSPAAGSPPAPMAHKERWLGNRIATASAAPVGDAVKPAIGYTHHLTSGANPASVIPAQAGIQRAAVQPRKGFKRDSGFRQNDDIGWSGRMTDLAPRHASIVQKAVASRRVLLPMHLKEHWFRERTLTPAVVSPAVGPAPAPMVHKERWFRTRTFAAALDGEPAHSGFRQNDESGWSGRMTEGARPSPASVNPAQAGTHPAAAKQRKAFKRSGLRQNDDKRWRVLLPMHLKEHWFRDRTTTPAAVAPAAGPAPAPMAHKERWLRTRIFPAALDGEPAPSPKYADGAILPKGGGRQQIGKPYQVAGLWYTPKEEPDYDVSGIASWYGSAFHRRMTSNGEWFDMEYLSAAHPTMPLPSYAKVTNMDNGSELIVRVNDRGPFAAGRIIDLSKKCAETLGFRDRGTARVRVQYVGAAPLDDGGSHLRAMNRELRRGTAFERMLGAADAASQAMAAADSTPAQAF